MIELFMVVAITSAPEIQKAPSARLMEIEVKNIDIDLQRSARQILNDLEAVSLADTGSEHSVAKAQDSAKAEDSTKPKDN